MADIDAEDRYGLFGLAIGLQNKDLPLITENLMKVRLLQSLPGLLYDNGMIVNSNSQSTTSYAQSVRIPQGHLAIGSACSPSTPGFVKFDEWKR